MALMYDDILYGTDVFENASLGLDDPAPHCVLGRLADGPRMGAQQAAAPGTAAIVAGPGEHPASFLGLPWCHAGMHVPNVPMGDVSGVDSGVPGGMALEGHLSGGPVHPPPAMEERNPSSNSGNSSCAVGECNEGIGHAEKGAAPVHPQISCLMPASKQQMQRSNSSSRRTKKGAPPASASPKDSESDEEMNGHLGNRKSTPHSTVEKARRDRLNHLIEALAELVPASDRKYSSEAGGVRRPKHVILSDTHNLLRKLKSTAAHGPQEPLLPDHATSARAKSQTASPRHPVSKEPAAADTRLHRRQQSSSSTEQVASQQTVAVPLEMPVPFGMGPGCTGVLVEQRAINDTGEGAIAWRVTVTCRDRKGLLLDMASALAKLPITVQAAALRVSSDSSRAQGAFDVLVQDSSLSPDEVQCVMNAAMYAYFINSSQGVTGGRVNLAGPSPSAAPLSFPPRQERLLPEVLQPAPFNKRARS